MIRNWGQYIDNNSHNWFYITKATYYVLSALIALLCVLAIGGPPKKSPKDTVCKLHQNVQYPRNNRRVSIR